MKLPREVPVMTLPNATLFPQAMLPLYIFEPRYRQMLTDALDSNRMFSVAMQKPGNSRETPLSVAGLGLIRVSVKHRNGTSHLILQGVARVELAETVRYKPYRIHRVRPLRASPCDNVTVDALLAKLRELLVEHVKLGLPFPPFTNLSLKPEPEPASLATFSSKEILNYLETITDPEQIADQVSYAALPEASQRQTILETVDVETRLRRLIHFLLAAIQRRKSNS